MNELEEKLNAVLNNPQMMQQILSIAQSMGQPQEQPVQQTQGNSSAPVNMPDPKMLQNLAGLASQSSIDREQQALLHALSPYLSRERVSKLERAMKAARMANFASGFLNAGGLQMLSGR